jgi:hypothetical protein
MTFFKDLFADLVNKRLWPVAIALLAALVAVPLALSKPEPHDQAAESAAQAAASKAQHDAIAAEPVVSIATSGSPAHANLRGLHAVDPFKQHHLIAASTPTGDTAAGGTGAAGSGTGSGSGSGSGSTGTGTGAAPGRVGGQPTSPGTPPEPSPPQKTYTTYHVDVRFGEAGAERVHNDLPRLTPLPSSSDPVIIFVGMDKDGKTAIFLVTSDASPQGDGTCEPSKTTCTYVHMTAGQEEFLDVSSGTAGLRQYVLKLLKVNKTTTTSAAAAAAAFNRESSAGRDILRSEVGSLGRVRYNAVTGTLYSR